MPHRLTQDAADEIERLRERNVEHESRYDALEALEQIRRDEIERLRAAVDASQWHREEAEREIERLRLKRSCSTERHTNGGPR